MPFLEVSHLVLYIACRGGGLVRIFKNKWFARLAAAEDIDDRALRRAIEDAEKGLVDADLGGGVIKQRIARQGQGAAGGYRSVILYRKGLKAFFVFGFAKGRMDNIGKGELRGFKKLAKVMLTLTDRQIEDMKKAKSLMK
jgi:hypothetical protein